jgi:hypothetical protein
MASMAGSQRSIVASAIFVGTAAGVAAKAVAATPTRTTPMTDNFRMKFPFVN